MWANEVDACDGVVETSKIVILRPQFRTIDGTAFPHITPITRIVPFRRFIDNLVWLNAGTWLGAPHLLEKVLDKFGFMLTFLRHVNVSTSPVTTYQLNIDKCYIPCIPTRLLDEKLQGVRDCALDYLHTVFVNRGGPTCSPECAVAHS